MSEETMPDGSLAPRVAKLEETILQLKEAIERIASSMESLVRLEERHAATRDSLARAFDEIEKVGTHIDELAKNQQGFALQLESARLVRTIVFGGVGLVLVAVLILVLTHSGLPNPNG